MTCYNDYDYDTITSQIKDEGISHLFSTRILSILNEHVFKNKTHCKAKLMSTKTIHLRRYIVYGCRHVSLFASHQYTLKYL